MTGDIAIIGAGGFIGQHLIRELAVDGNSSLHLYGKRPPASYTGPGSFSVLDFDSNSQLRAVAMENDIVFYLASETIPSSSWQNPFLDIDKNLNPFLRFLEETAGSRLKKIVFVSSAGTVYGATNGKVPENFDKRPFSPYGIIKLTMENFLEYYRHRFGLQYDVFRVSNVYGPGQNTAKGLGIVNTFLEKIITEKKITVFGDGSSTRNYVYVQDVARILARTTKDLSGTGIYNLASDSTASVNELISVISEVVDERFTVEYATGRLSDNSFIDLDNTKLKKDFPGFYFTSLREGIKKTYSSLTAKQ